MEPNNIYDAKGQITGRILKNGATTYYISKKGVVVGYYKADLDKTFRKNGTFYGIGDQGTRLL
jgi:hypothetical protein